MATDVTLNGVVYSIPEVGDSGWGANVSSYLVALPSNLLQKAGGTFVLTNPVDFGADNGLNAISYSARSSDSPATAGVFRLPNNQSVAWRNAAGNADIELKINASDAFEIDGNSIQTTSLPSAKVWVGNASNVANAVDITGDIGITNTGVTTIASGVIVNNDINASAGISRSKLSTGATNNVVINNGTTGAMTSEAQLAKSRGGTGADNTNVTFPATGAIVTRDETETLENKTLVIPELTTGADFEDLGAAPANPDAGNVRVYVESGALQYRDSSGTVTTIGAGLSSLNGQTGSTQTFSSTDGSITITSGANDHDIEIASSVLNSISNNAAAIAVNSGNIGTNASNISTNTSDIATLDSEVVKLTGNQTIADTKTFTSKAIFRPGSGASAQFDNTSGVASTEYLNNGTLTGQIYAVSGGGLDFHDNSGTRGSFDNLGNWDIGRSSTLQIQPFHVNGEAFGNNLTVAGKKNTTATMSVSNGASGTFQISTQNNIGGLLIIHNNTNSRSAIVYVGFSGGATIMADFGSSYIASSSPSAGQTGVTYSNTNSTVTIHNNVGGTSSYHILAFCPSI